MFKSILDSFPRQAREALHRQDSAERAKDSSSPYTKELPKEPANVTSQVKHLQELGFGREDCVNALAASNGQIDEAALWLTRMAEPLPIETSADGGKEEDGASLHIKEPSSPRKKKNKRTRTASVKGFKAVLEDDENDDDDVEIEAEESFHTEGEQLLEKEEIATFLAGTPMNFAFLELKTRFGLKVVDLVQ